MTADGAPGAGGVELPPGLELPSGGDGPTFEAPWQARVFATVVALHQRHGEAFDWADFQALLIDEIGTAGPPADPDDVEAAYYGQWLRAAERLLLDAGVVDEADLEARAAEFAGGERNAQEFIEGEHQDAHGHSHEHDQGRSHGHEHGRSRGHDGGTEHRH